jgi:hypothetical protein
MMRSPLLLPLIGVLAATAVAGCARTRAARQLWWRGQDQQKDAVGPCDLGWRLDDGRCITATSPRSARSAPERHPVVADSEVNREPTALETCATDRRCRLDRIKRKNQARRLSQQLRDEQVVAAIVAEQEKERRRSLPRVDKPWLVDQRTSLFGVLGLDLGYSFGRIFQAGTSYLHDSDDVWVEGDLTTGFGGWGGDLSTHWWTTGVSLLPYTGSFTPYAGVAFARVWGDFDSELYIPRTVVLPDGNTYIETDVETRSVAVEFHAVELQAGIDFQAQAGFHARLGFVYRAPVYTQARTGPGEYHDEVRSAMKDWFDDNARFDFALTVGWAF